MDKKLLCEVATGKVVDSDKKYPPELFLGEWYGTGNPAPDRDVPSMKCPDCGANMVRRLAPGICMPDPPQRELQWWCGCGKTLRIRFEVIPGSRREKPAWEREWEEANSKKEFNHA